MSVAGEGRPGEGRPGGPEGCGCGILMWDGACRQYSGSPQARHRNWSQ